MATRETADSADTFICDSCSGDSQFFISVSGEDIPNKLQEHTDESGSNARLVVCKQCYESCEGASDPFAESG